jgi:hypothetical protein
MAAETRFQKGIILDNPPPYLKLRLPYPCTSHFNEFLDVHIISQVYS